MTAFEQVTFGSSGIRGPYGTQVTPELALALGASCAGLAKSIVVGRDARTTGPVLERAFVAGALGAGAEVTTLGLATTPTVAHAARHHDLGVVLTASHNPPTDNGFKFWAPDGSALGRKGREQILAGLRDPPARAPWDGVDEPRHDPGLVIEHKRAILDEVDPIDGHPRIVVDAGNGPAGPLVPGLLSALGASVTTLNAQPDGSFPGRPSEPTPEHLTDLRELVPRMDAVCGIAHDGDGDRCVAVDERGRVLSGDVLIVLLARALDARCIAVPVDTSQLVWEALPDTRIEVTPVGDAYVSEALARAGGDYGGEPSGAHILPTLSLCPDGPHAAARVASLAARHGGLAELVDELPTYQTRRTSLALGTAGRDQVIDDVSAALEGLGQANTLDGLRVDTEDGWLLVRPSGTEPKVRITAEARDAARADELAGTAGQAVQEALSAATGG